MAFCPNCGTEVQGRFCAKCGSPVAAPANPAAQGMGAGDVGGGAAMGGGPAVGGTMGGTAPPPGAPMAATQSSGLADNMASALCYLLGVLTGVLFLVLEPYNRNRTIRFHAFQSIFVWIAMVAIWIVVTMLSLMLATIPFLGFMLSVLLHFGVALGIFVLWLMLMYKAYNN